MSALDAHAPDPHERVEQWLIFVRDFCYLDTTPLLERLHAEPQLVDAIDVLISRNPRSSEILAAVRDFCVQALMGTDAPAMTPRPHLQTALTPYSLPYGLLQSTLASLRKTSWRLATRMWVSDKWPFLRLSDDALCVLTNCRLITPPNLEPDTEVRISDRASNRQIFEGRIALLPAHDFPLFYVAVLNSELEIRTRPSGHGQDDISVVIWGWECRPLP